MNPYSPPKSGLEEPSDTTDSRFVAIVLGAVIGNGICYSVLYIFGLAFLWVLAMQGVPAQETYMQAYQSVPYLLACHTLGFLCLIPGGYWCARLSRDRHLMNAALAGVLMLLFNLTANLYPYDLPIPFWSRVVSLAASIPPFLIGAALWQRRRS
ncbi:hypothetical protein [Viridibacterium curvum]|uniref:Uncharacterized protein n=1 Tax=Viridibacterium curvum TaxID=1101404 RepID=A0ABP9QPQ7_9RHOO